MSCENISLIIRKEYWICEEDPFAMWSIGMVPLKCIFTHTWRSTHGYTQIFACKIQKISVEIFIFHETWNSTRRGVARDVKYNEV